MRNLQLIMIGACLISIAIPSLAQSEPELNALRDELRQLRTDYETRIAELERRLEIAEQKTDKQQVATTQDTVHGVTAPQTVQTDQSQVAAASTQNNRTGSGLFNPDIGVIFTGRAWSYDNNPDDYEIPGFPLGGETELAPDGLSLGETEINISANVDDKFTAWLTVPIHIHDGNTEIDVEEAWIETLKLPAGLSLRMGRFFSNIGYLNEKHPHAWDFADQPLPYKAFLGNHYLDDGLQMRITLPVTKAIQVTAPTPCVRKPVAMWALATVGKLVFLTYRRTRKNVQSAMRTEMMITMRATGMKTMSMMRNRTTKTGR
jgi:hypothetical protein